MKFHGILMTRDSADIIEESLTYALTWADFLYVCDTGSTDGTWDIVEAIARRDSRVYASRWPQIVFHEGVRSVVFHRYRKFADDGDWFAKVDEDEFYHVPPPVFVKTCCRPHETSVWSQTYEFRLTWQELEAGWDAASILRERSRPISERRRHFVPLQYSEPRMFRYRRSMVWTPDIPFPWNAGFTARMRIPIRHYPHRDPLQISQRLAIRQAMLPLLPPGTYPHWNAKSWGDFVLDQSDPDLVYWPPGDPLPEYRFTNHLAPSWKRLAQRLVHAALLPVLDRCRPTYPEAYRPTVIGPTPSPSHCAKDNLL